MNVRNVAKKNKINYFSLYEEIDNMILGLPQRDVKIMNQLYKLGYVTLNRRTGYYVMSELFTTTLTSCMNCLTDFCDKVFEDITK